MMMMMMMMYVSPTILFDPLFSIYYVNRFTFNLDFCMDHNHSSLAYSIESDGCRSRSEVKVNVPCVLHG